MWIGSTRSVEKTKLGYEFVVDNDEDCEDCEEDCRSSSSNRSSSSRGGSSSSQRSIIASTIHHLDLENK